MRDVVVDDHDLLAALAHTEKQAGPSLVRALNAAIGSVRTAAQRRIRARLNLPASRALAAIRVQRARQGEAAAALRIAGRQVALSYFKGTRQVRRGVSVKIFNDRPRELIEGAFLAKMKSGHEGVFWRRKATAAAAGAGHRRDHAAFQRHAQRTLRAGINALVGRLPIDERFSIAVQQVLQAQDMDQLLAFARQRIRIEIGRQIERYWLRQTGEIPRRGSRNP